jgi:hypothetical protein
MTDRGDGLTPTLSPDDLVAAIPGLDETAEVDVEPFRTRPDSPAA